MELAALYRLELRVYRATHVRVFSPMSRVQEFSCGKAGKEWANKRICRTIECG